MAKYEMLYLLKNDLSDEAKDAKVAKFENVVSSMGGSVLSSDKWGTKKTAYPIAFKNESYYVLMTFEADDKMSTGVATCESKSPLLRRSWASILRGRISLSSINEQRRNL
jgi:small subunit ribosomal protein S6